MSELRTANAELQSVLDSAKANAVKDSDQIAKQSTSLALLQAQVEQFQNEKSGLLQRAQRSDELQSQYNSLVSEMRVVDASRNQLERELNQLKLSYDDLKSALRTQNPNAQ
ncbi:MAG: hypothetical protein R3Y10_12930 [Ferrimonas sp.]